MRTEIRVTQADLAQARGGIWPGPGDGGRLTVEIPDHYDARIITAEDVIHDAGIRIVEATTAAALGRLGGKAGRGEAKRRGDSAHYRAIARRTGYAVTIRYSGGDVMVDVLTSLAAAKRLARASWDARPGMHVRIEAGARSWTATQRQAAGMRWTG